jgi:hypothetical protein
MLRGSLQQLSKLQRCISSKNVRTVDCLPVGLLAAAIGFQQRPLLCSQHAAAALGPLASQRWVPPYILRAGGQGGTGKGEMVRLPARAELGTPYSIQPASIPSLLQHNDPASTRAPTWGCTLVACTKSLNDCFPFFPFLLPAPLLLLLLVPPWLAGCDAAVGSAGKASEERGGAAGAAAAAAAGRAGAAAGGVGRGSAAAAAAAAAATPPPACCCCCCFHWFLASSGPGRSCPQASQTRAEGAFTSVQEPHCQLLCCSARRAATAAASGGTHLPLPCRRSNSSAPA